MRPHKNFSLLLRYALAASLCTSSFACKMPNTAASTFLRDQNLPMFDPHMPAFVCEFEATKVPPIDAQAEAWFLEARALENPETVEDARDYKRIVQLTRQAAERRHWKAMLNLASLYIEGRDAAHGVEDAVVLVEQAMQLGIPAAYDRMGTYFMNGTGVRADATRAYAFLQKAAQLGNPQAMSFLGDKLRAGTDGAIAGYWANIPVATKMLECALGQGYGPAAFNLHYLYVFPRAANGDETGGRTPETKARSLRVLHEGVRLGCVECANKLFIEFGEPFDLATMLAPFVDKARGDRYRVLGRALDFDPDSRFPNLDKVLPLPPADLPPWNGDRDTLLEAAMGVSLKRPPPKPTAASQYTDRRFLDAGFQLRPAGEKTSDQTAPMTGYWQPTANRHDGPTRAMLAGVEPGLYGAGEAFQQFASPNKEELSPLAGVVWERWETIRYNHGEIDPLAATALTRAVACPEPLVACASNEPCPVSGIWQPWVPAEHPMHTIVNRHWRQAWLKQGQAFPTPEHDWLLALPEVEVKWYLFEPSGLQDQKPSDSNEHALNGVPEGRQNG